MPDEAQPHADSVVTGYADYAKELFRAGRTGWRATWRRGRALRRGRCRRLFGRHAHPPGERARSEPRRFGTHFFEFLPEDGGEAVGLADLETGAAYDVVLTTSGGLTRYRLNDRVRVAGRWRGVPCLTFLGKSDRVSDRFGEKLHAAHVQRCLDRLRPDPLPVDGFAMLAPEAGEPLRYVLFAETDAPAPALRAASETLETGWRRWLGESA